MSLPIIAVIGATGQQGGSVVRHAVKSGKFRVRALTRNAKDDKAKALAALSPLVEVVEADQSNKASMVKAFTGAWGLFAVTFTDYKDPEGKGQLQQGLDMIAAAEEAKVGFVVWSGVDDIEKETGGKYKLPIFSITGKIEAAFQRSRLPTATIVAGHFYQNYLTFLKPQPASDGVLELRGLTRCDVGMPCCDITEIGVLSQTMFENPKEWIGKRIEFASEYITLPNVVAAISKAIGKPVRYNRLPIEEARKVFFPGHIEMYQVFNEFGYYLGRDISATRARWPQLKTAEQFFKEHAAAFTSAAPASAH